MNRNSSAIYTSASIIDLSDSPVCHGDIYLK